MDRRPRITAEADIGERDSLILLDNVRIQAGNLFPCSIKEVEVIHKKLILVMTRPTTMPGLDGQNRCHAQIQHLFQRNGLEADISEETIEAVETKPQSNPIFEMSTRASAELATQTTA